MEGIKIRKGNKKDVFDTADLIYKTFKRFNYKEGTEKGVKSYLNLHDTKKEFASINERYLGSRIFLIAEKDNKLIGVIMGKENKIGNLFVEEKYHKKGIAKKLINRFEKEAIKLGSETIKVRASLSSVDFYKKMGYKKSTGIKEKGGIKFQPMIKKLK